MKDSFQNVPDSAFLLKCNFCGRFVELSTSGVMYKVAFHRRPVSDGLIGCLGSNINVEFKEVKNLSDRGVFCSYSNYKSHYEEDEAMYEVEYVS